MYRLSFLLALVLFSTTTYADRTLYGKAVKIHDGDGTIWLLDANKVRHKIRLAGIDAPELKRGKKWDTQPFAKKSKQNLNKLIGNKYVEAYCHKKDRYNRDICKLIIPGTTKDIALEQIKAGLAWHHKRFQHEQSDYDRKAYALAELKAKNEKQGLWADKNPIPPWQWRKKPPIKINHIDKYQ